tara:strand:- start:1838 stop:2083 length:246 start_codon:yes stop_codon:yes gene_type:complete
MRKDEVEDAFHDVCISQWDTEYRVFWKADDGGNHLVVAFEGAAPKDSHDKLQSVSQGVRFVRLVVPVGYLEVFYPLNKKTE